jgi:hypothetical protein
MQNNDGLLCEIDETKNQFSLRKLILLPLLIIATIICGYFALPTTRTVAVTKSVEQIRSGYVTKSIEDIKIGDEVFAYDVTTGKTSKCKVTDTFERTSDHLRYLTVCDSKGTQIFETTDSHPFWVVTDKPDLSRTARETVNKNDVILQHENITPKEHGYYVEAKDLKVGDTFIGASNEVSVLVATQRKNFPEGITVYNFTVEDNHNYFVIANYEAYQNGASVVLVHNAGGIYEFDDLSNSGKKYVGQTNDFDTRLSQHKAAGRLNDINDAITNPIDGNKLTREIAEHKRIQELSGGVPARLSEKVSNQRDPIGSARKHFLDK